MRWTPQTAAVVRALLNGSNAGYDMLKETGLPSGTVYPILARLEGNGYVRSVESPSTERGRPPRRTYEVTDLGWQCVRENGWTCVAGRWRAPAASAR